MNSMPIDLAAVDWLYVIVLALFVFLATLIASVLSFGRRFMGALLSAILAGGRTMMDFPDEAF